MVRYVGFGLGLTIAVGLAVALYKIGRGNSWPMFFHDAVTRTFDCYVEGETKDRSITIQFQDQGRTALVQSRGDTALVKFQSGGWTGDRYRSGQVSLVIDPEVYVTGMKGGSRGPCQ